MSNHFAHSNNFSEASLKFHIFISEMTESLVTWLNNHQPENIQHFHQHLIRFSQSTPQVIHNYKNSLQDMPKELKQRHVTQALSAKLDNLQNHVSIFVEEFQRLSSEDLKQAFLRNYKEASQLLSNFEQQLQSLAHEIKTLETHAIFQKFVRGEQILSSKKNIQWMRKIGHAVLGVAVLYLFLYSGLSTIAVWSVTGTFIALALGLEISRHFNPQVNQWVCRVFKPVMRESEKTKINSSMFYIFSMLLVYALFPMPVVSITILFLALGDPLAGIFGVYFGKRKIADHVSVAGFVACCLSCAVIAGFSVIYLLNIPVTFFQVLGFSVLAGLVGGLAEASFKTLDDNLVMPLISAPCIWILLELFF